MEIKISQFRTLCKPLDIQVDCRWGEGFLVKAKTSQEMIDKLTPLGFSVRSVGMGYDYNRKLSTMYAEKQEAPK